MSLPITGFSHVRLTVTDIARSRRFYDDVLGLPVAFELPADADEATREQMWWLFGGVVYQVPGGFFGLRPVAPGEDRFDEDRAGLDHLPGATGAGSRTTGSRTSGWAPCWSSATPTTSPWSCGPTRADRAQPASTGASPSTVKLITQ